MEHLFKNDFIKVVRDEKSGDTVVCDTDAVAVLVYLKDLDCLVFIEQKRPAKKYGQHQHDPDSMEIVAGRFDGNYTIQQLAVKEVEEEIGLKLSEAEVVIVNDGSPISLSPGIVSGAAYLAYVEVDSRRLSARDHYQTEGGEDIRRHVISCREVVNMTFNDAKTMALVSWFLSRKRLSLLLTTGTEAKVRETLAEVGEILEKRPELAQLKKEFSSFVTAAKTFWKTLQKERNS
ncbi:MAG: NUDIX hydrolase [Candidatus Komeilibacteria bacterium]|nr:NUDIX hydrolase [Candidatus Komeilibacteria bacterium]